MADLPDGIALQRVWMGPKKLKPGFYVSAILGPRRALVAGPFKTHREAKARVEPERDEWIRTGDARASFAAWGTSRIRGKNAAPGCGCDPPCEEDVS